MTYYRHSIKVSAGWVCLTLGLVGCGQNAPPYDELPLRDALRAAPEVMASLPYETRREIAQRLDAAALEQDESTTFDMPEAVTIDSLARNADETREDRGHDALILGEIIDAPKEFTIRDDGIDENALGRVNVGPIDLQGRPGAETQALEDIALRGRAGKWLRELSGRTNTQQMVRTTGLPFGAWVFEEKLYVNASWLVAMSALEVDGQVSTPVNTSITTTTIQPPPKTPLTVDYNPYNLPGTIAQCAEQVTTTCQCGSSCSQDVTDSTFKSAVEECAWVNQDTSHPAALCILALMSIDDVRVCVESAGSQCAALPVTTRDSAVVFAQNTTCMSLLDTCLRDGYIPQSSGSSGSSCNNNSNSGSSGDSCSSCNKSCSDCNNNWSSCNKNCSDSNKNASSCGKCSVKPDPGQSPLPEPIGSTFWLVAPAAYVLLRNRRRS